MALVCAQCSRVNPPEASYCFYDGAALTGRAGGPINPGSAPFPTPFVFPNGQTCRNFDQLATTCQHHWAAAVDLLKQGFLASFFGGLGRVDLAMAAQEAAKFPDADRGLDQLLAKLPTQVLEAPKLQAEPREINLGRLKVGDDRATELHLTNLGMRLVYGTVASDAKWLTLGDAPGHSEKLFQFGAEAVIPVHVRGQHLRAQAKPLVGKLVVESNGAPCTITVRAEVPITPYAGGLFDGATTPREIDVKAHARPKEAAAYFEDGRVAAWFKSNGWTYPVQGPAMAGTGAVQQFFEALGFAKAPKVDVAVKELRFEAEPGKRIEATIDVTSAEKKLVYGWAAADVPWVEVGRTKLNGRTATIPVTIPSVPDRAGTLEAKLTVTANGGQKCVVPLRLAVIGGKATEEPPPLEMAEIFDDTEPAPPPPPPATMLAPPAAVPAPPDPGLDFSPESVVVAPPAPVQPRPAGSRAWIHLVPLAALAVVLLGFVARDVVYRLFINPSGEVASGDVDPRQVLGLFFDYNTVSKKDKLPSWNNLSFGLTAYDFTRQGGPSKKMTYGKFGHSNSTLVRVDGKDKALGSFQTGKWIKPPEPVGKYGGKVATFLFPQENVLVTQEVRLVPGEPREVSPGVYKRLVDTCFVRYKLENRDTGAHQVGLRFLLDTCIGDNDGAPFTLPGSAKLVDTGRDFKGRDVPDFVQVLEQPDLKSPGLVTQLSFRVDPARFEPPDRVLLTQHPGNKDHWPVPLRDMKDAMESAVVLYWEPAEIAAGRSRELAFSYGIGDVSIGPDAKLGVTVGGSFTVGGELTVVALVGEPRAGQAVTLTLPSGLELVQGAATQTLPPPEKSDDGKVRPSPVTWRVRATAQGAQTLTVESAGVTQERQVTIRRSKLF